MSEPESRTEHVESPDSVVDDLEEVAIAHAGHDPVAVVSLDDHRSLQETGYLLRSPENARRLVAAIEALESGGGIQRELIE
ncbi:type II toxin-antitoxin system Phd/YefM family antitoxin [Marinactinospora rubrisoli]|uniref:Antitoxin n=1 Tax=Marinactinospora rubrisoli TaxID=2715399 RepID=A0ABW2KHW9_9ACTN